MRIPAKIKELADKEAFEIQLTENLQRMNMNQIKKANALTK
jgi:ParB family transcriptional regulator, chromosome partitioning protein